MNEKQELLNELLLDFDTWGQVRDGYDGEYAVLWEPSECDYVLRYGAEIVLTRQDFEDAKKETKEKYLWKIKIISSMRAEYSVVATDIISACETLRSNGVEADIIGVNRSSRVDYF